MIRRLSACALLLAASAAFAVANPPPVDFDWKAPLVLPPGAGVVRVPLPGGAFAHARQPDLRDVRVFNADGDIVPFAIAAAAPASASAPAQRTPPMAALPLYTASAPVRGKGSVRVRIDGTGAQTVWVQAQGAAPEGASRLPAVLFDTRALKQPLGAIEVEAKLPANTPVTVTVSTSPDLAQWTPVPVKGRLYRFDGENAPRNATLAFDKPVALEKLYLRLDAPGAEIASFTGIVQAGPRPARVSVPLARRPGGSPEAVEFDTGFATRIAAVAVSTSRENTLVPVRVQTRAVRSQPWRNAAQATLFRLAGDVVNGPVSLGAESPAGLRLASTTGADVAALAPSAAAEFDPVDVVFVASGPGPFTLAVGHASAPGAALPVAVIEQAQAGRPWHTLPLATAGEATLQAREPPAWLDRTWPDHPPARTLVLWGVLLAGVLLLGAAAWTLVRQLDGGKERARTRHR